MKKEDQEQHPPHLSERDSSDSEDERMQRRAAHLRQRSVNEIRSTQRGDVLSAGGVSLADAHTYGPAPSPPSWATSRLMAEGGFHNPHTGWGVPLESHAQVRVRQECAFDSRCSLSESCEMCLGLRKYAGDARVYDFNAHGVRLHLSTLLEEVEAHGYFSYQTAEWYLHSDGDTVEMFPRHLSGSARQRSRVVYEIFRDSSGPYAVEVPDSFSFQGPPAETQLALSDLNLDSQVLAWLPQAERFFVLLYDFFKAETFMDYSLLLVRGFHICYPDESAFTKVAADFCGVNGTFEKLEKLFSNHFIEQDEKPKDLLSKIKSLPSPNNFAAYQLALKLATVLLVGPAIQKSTEKYLPEFLHRTITTAFPVPKDRTAFMTDTFYASCEVVKGIAKFLQTGDPIHLQSKPDEVFDWCERVERFLAEYATRPSVKTNGVKNVSIDFGTLIEEGKRLTKVVYARKDGISAYYNRVYADLVSEESRFLANNSSKQARIPAFCVGLIGDPGIGKTSRFLPNIEAVLFKELGIEPDPALIFTQGKSQYAEGMDHRTVMLVLDDPTVTFMKPGDNPFDLVHQAAGTSPMYPDFAFEQKGSSVNIDVVIVLGNNVDMGAALCYRDPLVYNRRVRRYRIIYTGDAKYKKLVGVDVASLPWGENHFRVELISEKSSANNITVLASFSEHEFYAHIVSEFRKSRETGAVLRDQAQMKAPFCSVCNLPLVSHSGNCPGTSQNPYSVERQLETAAAIREFGGIVPSNFVTEGSFSEIVPKPDAWKGEKVNIFETEEERLLRAPGAPRYFRDENGEEFVEFGPLDPTSHLWVLPVLPMLFVPFVTWGWVILLLIYAYKFHTSFLFEKWLDVSPNWVVALVLRCKFAVVMAVDLWLSSLYTCPQARETYYSAFVNPLKYRILIHDVRAFTRSRVFVFSLIGVGAVATLAKFFWQRGKYLEQNGEEEVKTASPKTEKVGKTDAPSGTGVALQPPVLVRSQAVGVEMPDQVADEPPPVPAVKPLMALPQRQWSPQELETLGTHTAAILSSLDTMPQTEISIGDPLPEKDFLSLLKRATMRLKFETEEDGMTKTMRHWAVNPFGSLVVFPNHGVSNSATQQLSIDETPLHGFSRNYRRSFRPSNRIHSFADDRVIATVAVVTGPSLLGNMTTGLIQKFEGFFETDRGRVSGVYELKPVTLGGREVLGYVGPSNSMRGDCGRPLVGMLDVKGQKIPHYMGFLSGGKEEFYGTAVATTGVFMPVFNSHIVDAYRVFEGRDDCVPSLAVAVDAFGFQAMTEDLKVGPLSARSRFLAFASYGATIPGEAIGSLENSASMTPKQKMFLTTFADKIPGLHHERWVPATGNLVQRFGTYPTSWSTAFWEASIDSNMRGCPEDIFQFAVGSLIKTLDSRIPYDTLVLRNLSVQEAFSGVPDTTVGRLPANTSAGNIRLKGAKSAYYQLTGNMLDPQQIMLTPDAFRSFVLLLSYFKRGRTPVNLVTLTPKLNEVLKVAKAALRPGRTINNLWFIINGLLRWALGGVFDLLRANRKWWDVAIGVNAMSSDWAEMYNYMEEFSPDHCFDPDVKDMDSRLSHSDRIAGPWRVFFHIARRMGLSPQRYRVAKFAVALLIYYAVVMRVDIARVSGKNPTGQPYTTEENSIVMALFIRISYFLNQRRVGRPLADDFDQNVRPRTYGDDGAVSVKQAVTDWFNPVSFQDRLAEINVDVTFGSSKDNAPRFKHCSELNFLKRTFTPYETPFGQRVIKCPLELESIEKSLSWFEPSKVMDVSEQQSCILENACKEYFFHSRELYESKCQQFATVASECGLPPLKGLKPYSEMWDDYVKGSFRAW